MDDFVYSTDIANFCPILTEFAKENSFIIELGPAKGDGSTHAFELGLKRNRNQDKLFISVDHRDYMEIKPKVPYWHLILGDSRDFTTRELVKGFCGNRKPDLIFIDTHHTYEQMQQELKTWSKIASKKHTKWLFHDTYMMGEYNHMTDAIKEFAQENGLIYADLKSEAHGLGFMHA